MSKHNPSPPQKKKTLHLLCRSQASSPILKAKVARERSSQRWQRLLPTLGTNRLTERQVVAFGTLHPAFEVKCFAQKTAGQKWDIKKQKLRENGVLIYADNHNSTLPTRNEYWSINDMLRQKPVDISKKTPKPKRSHDKSPPRLANLSDTSIDEA